MSDDRTERATSRRRQQAAQKGDRVRSRDLVSSIALLAGVAVLGHTASHWASQWSLNYQLLLSLGMPSAWQDDHLPTTVLAVRHAMVMGLLPLLLLFAVVVGTALVVSVAQGGGLQLNFEALQPRWNAFNPISNLQHTLSLRGLTRMLKSLLPAALLVVLAFVQVRKQAAIPPMSAGRLTAMFSTAYNILLDTAWILFVWSAFDYFVEWRSWENRQKMSKQEIRDEHKQSEGNPQVRGRIRRLRRQMHRRLLRADVRRASVVITNPTHYAVALSFDFESMEPPKMVAKGRDLIATVIREEAQWAGIPIVENPPLARSLYRHVEPGQAIPFNLYAAVAGILAYLYRQQVAERVRREQQLRARERS